MRTTTNVRNGHQIIILVIPDINAGNIMRHVLHKHIYFFSERHALLVVFQMSVLHVIIAFDCVIVDIHTQKAIVLFYYVYV
jgi:hypothetical protein